MIALVRPLPAGSSDEPRRTVQGTQVLGSRGSATGRIDPVRLGEGPLLPVPFGESSRASLDGEARRLEPLIDGPSRRVDRGRIFERRFPLGLHPREHLWSVGQEVFNGLITFLLITETTRDHQIGNPVAASTTLRNNMIDLQWNPCGLAVRAVMLPFGQQLVAQFCSE